MFALKSPICDAYSYLGAEATALQQLSNKVERLEATEITEAPRCWKVKDRYII